MRYVIYQNTRECLTMISKHEKAYEALGGKIFQTKVYLVQIEH